MKKKRKYTKRSPKWSNTNGSVEDKAAHSGFKSLYDIEPSTRLQLQAIVRELNGKATAFAEAARSLEQYL